MSRHKRCRTCHFAPCRCEDLAAKYMGRSNTPTCWPMKSDALACHPEQIPAMLERNKKHGVTGVTYDPVDGRAVFADRGARRMLMALEGVHDKRGGYGDDHAGESPIYATDGHPGYV